MKRSIILVFLFSICLSIFGQKTFDKYIHLSDTLNVYKKAYTSTDFDFTNGISWQLDSLPDGKYIQFIDSTGFVKFSIENMQLNGRFEHYQDNELSESGYYNKGEKSEIWKRYRHGNLNTINYYNNNVCSEYEAYYENGNKKLRGIIMEDGGDYCIRLHTYWYPNGNKKEQGLIKIDSECHTCVNCCKYKSWTYWYENGKVKASGAYNHTKEDGVWVNYDSLGNVLKYETYDKGKIIKTEEYINESIGLKQISKIVFKDSENKIIKTLIGAYNEKGEFVVEEYDKYGKFKKRTAGW